MPTEQLILRRVFPVPVTFADLRRAALYCAPPPWFLGIRHRRRRRPAIVKEVMTWWNAMLKESTGALDEVYAVIDGHEVRVATVDGPYEVTWVGDRIDRVAHEAGDLLIKADEAGYWQRPHEVRHVIEETMMSTRTRDRIALNSFAVAVATEWTDALIVAAGDDQ